MSTAIVAGRDDESDEDMPLTALASDDMPLTALARLPSSAARSLDSDDEPLVSLQERARRRCHPNGYDSDDEVIAVHVASSVPCSDLRIGKQDTHDRAVPKRACPIKSPLLSPHDQRPTIISPSIPRNDIAVPKLACPTILTPPSPHDQYPSVAYAPIPRWSPGNHFSYKRDGDGLGVGKDDAGNGSGENASAGPEQKKSGTDVTRYGHDSNQYETAQKDLRESLQDSVEPAPRIHQDDEPPTVVACNGYDSPRTNPARRRFAKPFRITKDNWCSICGMHMFGLRSRRLVNNVTTCNKAACQNLARQCPRNSDDAIPAAHESRGRALLSMLLGKVGVGRGNKENSTGPVEIDEDDECEKSAPCVPLDSEALCLEANTEDTTKTTPRIPKYEHIWKNKSIPDSLGNLLNMTPHGESEFGLCQCKDQCDPATCLNAALGIECTKVNCVFGKHWRGRCHNRQFYSAEQSAKKGSNNARIEVFYTGEPKGFGLRAKQAVDADCFVVEYVGEVVRQSSLQTGRYAMHVNKGAAIDASKMGGIARFANHSCVPNCCARRVIVGKEIRVGLFSMKPIQPGEEITFSYVQSGRGFGDHGSAEACLCGEKQCRGIIGAPAVKRSLPLSGQLKKRARRKRGRPPKLASAHVVDAVETVTKAGDLVAKHNALSFQGEDVERDFNQVSNGTTPLSRDEQYSRSLNLMLRRASED